MIIGCMVWRIGHILDFYDQIRWMRKHGFQSVEFWALPGSPGNWQGFDIQNASRADINKLKQELAGLKEVDIL